jgi:hypothetical protein
LIGTTVTETDLPPVVRGEIQPWTDDHPTGGPVLAAFLADLLPPAAGRVLVAGPHDSAVLGLVAGRSTDVTVLLRSVSDAEALRDSGHTVVAGALDGLAGRRPAPYDVVIAADGLDRLLGTDSPDLDWPERAALLRGLAAPGALVVIGVANEFSITGLLDRRPLKERHGDDEWRPLHDDPRRPSSPAQIADILGAGRRFALFGSAGRVHTLLESGALARTRPGLPAAGIARAGLAAAAEGTPLLAPLTGAAEAAARAGMLDSVAPGWLVVLGVGGPVHTAYTPSGAADVTADGWRFGDRLVPDTESAETVLFRLAAAEDVPGFRAYAAKLPHGAFFDEVHDFVAIGDGDIPPAAAWIRFRDRLVGGHRRHPWPPWMADGDDLVTMWLAMSGVTATAEILARGREIAGTEQRPDLLSALADAEAARVTVAEQAGHICGLERTMRFRDQQLRTREQQLRAMRDEMRRLRGGRAVRAAQLAGRVARLRDPKHLAGALKRRARAFLRR